MTPRVLVVDDEPALLDGLAYALRRENFDVTPVTSGEAALEELPARPYDLVILDIMLPDASGLDVCRRVRASSAIPIIMLTAKDSEVDKVVGLEVGADDYITKPFSALELLGRIRALLRRRKLDREASGADVHSLGALRLDVARHEATIGDRTIPLTPSEFKVLYVLASAPERIVSKREILEHLWSTTYVPDEHACDVHISNLRAKLEDDRSRPRRIVTVRGAGYKLMRV